MFDFDRFVSLSGHELFEYSDPFVVASLDAFGGATDRLLQADIDLMDNEHLVYAIEICMRLNAADFIEKAIPYLSHKDSAVCLAAFRAFDGLPLPSVPIQIVEQIQNVPVVDLLARHVRTGEEFRVGTNEQLVLKLKAKFEQG